MHDPSWQRFGPLAAIAVTTEAARALQPWLTSSGADLWLPADLDADLTAQRWPGRLGDQLPELWSRYRGLVFSLACGATVRLIAPLLQDKHTDPAVLVVGEPDQPVICLCGGHVGGGDDLARAVAIALDRPVLLSGSAEAQQRPPLDTFGTPFGWVRGSGNWTGVAATLARREPLRLEQSGGTDLWRQGWPDLVTDPAATATLHIGPEAASETARTVHWHPRLLWVGIGCERGSSHALIETAVRDALAEAGLAAEAIAGLASLDLKADEVGLQSLSQAQGWPLRCFGAEELKDITVPTPSAVVAAEVGTPSVAEAAALRACADYGGGQLRLNKRIFRQPNKPGAVTVAIAQAIEEFNPRPGQLALVGTGPGSLDLLPPLARQAIREADVLIGYGLYLDLLAPLTRPGQIREASSLTQERQRAERAIALARRGLSVAMVSSGDCGIYAMAGLVLECLAEQGWDGQQPAVRVVPGISALQSSASRVGAPLMHDFCAISLSDLLTPWPVIEQRLRAAAAADFVVALYNPRSKTRTTQVSVARDLMLEHRPVHTPVALVRSAYREDEQVTLTTLGEMLDHEIDMLTTVLIGNRSSFNHAGWFITPRGYLGFEPSRS